MTHDLTEHVETVLYAENHANLCNCKHWPDGCLNGLVPAFTLSVEDVLRVAAPLIVAAERERIASAIEALAVDLTGFDGYTEAVRDAAAIALQGGTK